MSNLKALESAELYTVGWIAALYKELSAALAMMDEEHDRPADFVQPSSDKNSYHWGRIGDYNIVVASLPDGVYGTTSAATTATQMLFSFRNIRIGLMVGIGAAIARPKEKRDIRLGDIVVSSPKGQTGGVVQYDLGKSRLSSEQGHPTHTFEPVGSLNSPPEALLKALTSLKAQVRRKGSKIAQFLQTMLEQNPAMAEGEDDEPGYIYQGEENDRLFEASYIHASDTRCDDCDPARMISRAARPNPEAPRVHYGVIALGNRLVKDAAERDEILQIVGRDCVCLEMEAAGLMNSFPCLVIRGICDYADSHKNDNWQEYAAATAAAYAKEFLGFVDNGDLARTSKASKILNQICKHTDETNTNVKLVGERIEEIQLDRHQKDVRAWLSALDPSTNYANALEKRHPDTGLWFIYSEAFQTWKRQPNSFLWLHGIAGCGKTVLSSTIIEHLEGDIKQDQMLLYFYFDFNDSNKQTLENMLRSLMSQLYQAQPEARSLLDELWRSHANGNQKLSKQLLSSTLLEMLKKVHNTSILLDALDESTTRGDVITWIKSALGLGSSCRVLVTARREEDIETGFRNWTQHEDCIDIRKGDIDGDIRNYVSHTVRNSKELDRWQNRPDVQDEIESKLVDKADGMFRWVACQLESLEDCLDYPSLRQALEDLPKTLNETYSRILEGIPRLWMSQATTILNLLIWSDHDFTIDELVDAVAVDLNHEPGFDPKNRMPVPREVLKMCSSLVSVSSIRRRIREPKVEVVHLAHFSVKEYLVSKHVSKAYESLVDETVARVYLAKLCLTYLFSACQFKPLLPKDRTWRYRTPILPAFPFADYSGQFWKRHTRGREREDEELWRLLIDLFVESPEALQFVMSLDNIGWDSSENRSLENSISYASTYGLRQVVEYLIDEGAEFTDPDVITAHDYLAEPLWLASMRGHNTTVKLLLGRGADVNAANGEALVPASQRGYDAIVRLLLYRSADPDARNGTALVEASQGGHDAIVQLLLDRGADVNASNGAALERASGGGCFTVVQLLLDRGADVNADDGIALEEAAERGYDTTVKLLIERGAVINAQNGAALRSASRRCTSTTVQLLLDHGADISAGDEYGRSALVMALTTYHDMRVRLLTIKDAYQSLQDYWADRFRRVEGVILVLLRCLSSELVAQQDLTGKNVLHHAAICGHEATVQRCLDLGVDIHARDHRGTTALHLAALYGNLAIVKMLMYAGSDANAFDNNGRTPLAHAQEGEPLELNSPYLLVQPGPCPEVIQYLSERTQADLIASPAIQTCKRERSPDDDSEIESRPQKISPSTMVERSEGDVIDMDIDTDSTTELERQG